jgi:NIMA (never in mitosis gene a)-related kinase
MIVNFLLKAKLLSQVRHPNIVSYKESFQGDDGFLYIVMAFCEGGDMYSRLKSQKGTYLEERQIVEWFVQIAMALQVRCSILKPLIIKIINVFMEGISH